MIESLWKGRIASANKFYEQWENRYRCKTLERYYRGFHWEADSGKEGTYTLNMVYSTLEIKLASYTFSNIQFHLKPKPNKSDYNLEFAIQSAQLKEDCINTIVSNPNGRFADEVEAALKDSFFRFGILETGYSADWITNPNVGKPLFDTDVDPNSSNSSDPKIIRQPDEIPQNELVYFKRIPAQRFRVGGIEG